MFYENQLKEDQLAYKNMLSIIGSLSKLFSDSENPMLYYRAHENCFCKFFKADNLSRHDCSADAKKLNIGIGLKTWVGSNNQKIAEFGKLKNKLDNLNDDDLVKAVAEFRNARIETTMRMYDIHQMIYHVVVRTHNQMNVGECSFDSIDINNIKRLPKKDGSNTRYFTDGKHTYNFNIAKTTLYMVFDDLVFLDEVPITILDDPFEVLEFLFPNIKASTNGLVPIGSQNKNRSLALKLFKETRNGCYVPDKSGLNIWNAKGRVRHPDEVYIPFNTEDRNRVQNKDFFPPKEQSFDLLLPDNKHISAKICQDKGKAIMSNPNKALGKWLLRDVLNLPEGTLVTYDLLQEKGFDTVVFEKIDDSHYSIDFTDSTIYDTMYSSGGKQTE